jgi:hypothetical protein
VRAPKNSIAVSEGFAPGDAVGLGWRSAQALVLADD